MADSDSVDEATLRALEERLERATAAAERLLGEAVDEAAGSGPTAAGPPPRGWQRAGDDREPGTERRVGGWIGAEDLELLTSLLSTVRELVPADLQQRVAAAVRELLLAVRALLDWALEHLRRRAAQPAEVQDIPIL